MEKNDLLASKLKNEDLINRINKLEAANEELEKILKILIKLINGKIKNIDFSEEKISDDSISEYKLKKIEQKIIDLIKNNKKNEVISNNIKAKLQILKDKVEALIANEDSHETINTNLLKQLQTLIEAITNSNFQQWTYCKLVYI